MRTSYFLLLLIFSFPPSTSFGQNAGFFDDFNDGDLTNGTIWQGDFQKFEVNNAQLHLNDSSNTSPAYLYTMSEAVNKAVWEFEIKMDFSPSGSNYTRIHLIADQAMPSLVQNGYFLQIGGQSGTVDDVSLFKIQNGTVVELIDGVDGRFADAPNAYLKLSKDSTGRWDLFSDTSSSRSALFNEGHAMDSSIGKSSYFIVECVYTSTRSDKFFLDNISASGEKFIDSLPPVLLSAISLADTSLLLHFDESLTQSSLDIQNFTLDHGIGNPISARFTDQFKDKIELLFNTKFANAGTYEIHCNNAMDLDSNSANLQIASFFYFVPDTPAYRDLVINEIYADENPSQGLPDAEFIEIFNASSKYFDMQGWELLDENSTMQFESMILGPNEYLILCSDETKADYGIYGRVQGTDDFPILTNSGETLQLKSPSGKRIDRINYSDTWYRDHEKSEGGCSLEQINPYAICNGKSNFTASISQIGGSPGSQNSVYNERPDSISPFMENIFLLTEDSIVIEFSESLDSASLKNSCFDLINNYLDTCYFSNEDRDIVLLSLASPVDTGKKMLLKVHDLSDCSGNLIEEAEKLLVLPFKPKSQELVINEILFNPRPEGFDFVEVHNRSEKIVALDHLEIATYKDDKISEAFKLADRGSYLTAGGFYVVSANRENILQEYPRSVRETVHEIDNLPSFNDDAGAVYLLDDSKNVIDSLYYSEDMHFGLLTEVEGVSLERVNPYIGSGESGNFQSAAESEGFATPGYLNSQYYISETSDGELNVDPELFSPDNDGYHDLLHINYHFGSPNHVANVTIFDKNGRKIRSLANNELLGREGVMVWNGLTDENEKARIGIYIIYFEVFKTDGSKMAFKESCVLAGHLD